MRIAIFTSWNVKCGVGSFGALLAAELHRLGHEVTILGNRGLDFVRKEGSENYLTLEVFGTGFHPVAEHTYDWPAINQVLNFTDVVIVNYQNFLFPNSDMLLQAARMRPTLAIQHDSCIPEHASAFFQACKRVLTCGDPTSPHYMPLGIAEFDFDKLERDESFFVLKSFGFGRTQLDYIVRDIERVNSTKLLSRPLRLEVSCSSHRPEVARLVQEHPEIISAIYEYMDDDTLSKWLHNAHLVVIRYPDIDVKVSSGCLRFSIGSKVPVMAQLNGWTKSLSGNGAWVEVTDDSWELDLLSLFTYYDLRSIVISQNQSRLLDEQGWRNIGNRYDQLLNSVL